MANKPSPQWDTRSGKVFTTHSELNLATEKAQELALQIEALLQMPIAARFSELEHRWLPDQSIRLPVTFADYLRRVVSVYRFHVFQNSTGIRQGEVLAELSAIEKAYKRGNFLEAVTLVNRSNLHTYHLLWDTLPLCNAGIQDVNEAYPKIAPLIPAALKHAYAQIRNNKSMVSVGQGRPSVSAAQLELATDIAHTLIDAGLSVTKTRGGLFDKVIQMTLKYAEFQHDDTVIAGTRRQDNFAILKGAVDRAQQERGTQFFCAWQYDPHGFAGL